MNDASGESSVTTETFSQTVIHEKSSGVSAGGGLNLDVSGIVPKLDLNANLAGKTTAVSQLDTSTTKTKTNRQVRPLPNLRWEIEARNPADPNSFLDDSYLAGQEMFSAGIVEGTNHVSIDGVIYCRKKEFGIIAVDKKIYDGFNGPKNREAIMSIVLQKAIKDADTSSGMLGEEFLILSRCKVTDMDF